VAVKTICAQCRKAEEGKLRLIFLIHLPIGNISILKKTGK